MKFFLYLSSKSGVLKLIKRQEMTVNKSLNKGIDSKSTKKIRKIIGILKKRFSGLVKLIITKNIEIVTIKIIEIE